MEKQPNHSQSDEESNAVKPSPALKSKAEPTGQSAVGASESKEISSTGTVSDGEKKDTSGSGVSAVAEPA